MTRRGLWVGALALALVVPSICVAYFPPTVGNPTLPPDPFMPPNQGGLGEPEPPEPPAGPTVQTPEPASIVTALAGLALVAGYGVRQRRRARAV